MTLGVAIVCSVVVGVVAAHALKTGRVAAVTSPEAAYVAEVSRSTDRFAGQPGFALATGRLMCAGISATRGRFVEPAPLSGTSSTDTHAVIAAATRFLCPWNRSRVALYLEGS